MNNKTWLVAEIDEAIKKAPAQEGDAPQGLTKKLDRFTGLQTKLHHYASTSKKRYGKWMEGVYPCRKTLRRRMNIVNYAILETNRDIIKSRGCITIQVPDGPEYTLINSKDSLKEFKKRVALRYIDSPVPEPKYGRTFPNPSPTPALPKTKPAQKDIDAMLVKNICCSPKELPRREILEQVHHTAAGEIMATNGRIAFVLTGYDERAEDEKHKVGDNEDAHYPRLQHTIPEYSENQVPLLTYMEKYEIDCRQFYAKLNKADTVCKESWCHALRLYKMPDGRIEVAAITGSDGVGGHNIDGCMRIGSDTFESARVRAGKYLVTFDCHYLKRVLEVFIRTGKDKVIIGYQDETCPVLLVADDCYAVIMPVRDEGGDGEFQPVPKRRTTQQ